MKIGVKIGAGFGGMIALLICVGGVGIWQLGQVVDAYNNRVMAKVYEEREIAKVPLLIVRAHSSEQKFVATSNDAYAKQAYDYLDLALNAVRNVQDIELRDESIAHLGEIEDAVVGYHRALDALVETLKERGVSENLGIRGELRAAAHQIEEQVSQNPDAEGHVLYLALRRYEKDFIMRARPRYVERVRETLEALDGWVQAARFGADKKREVQRWLGMYREHFEGFVVNSAKLVERLDDSRAASAEAIACADEAVLAGQLQMKSNIDEIDAATGVSVRGLWLVSALAIGVGLVAAFFLVRTITRPLGQITEVAQAIAEGDFSRQVTIDRSDEVGQLAVAFRGLSAYINSMALAADTLSRGDLTIAVEPKSDADQLAASFAHMAENLHRVFAQLNGNASGLHQVSGELSRFFEQVAGHISTVSDNASAASNAAGAMSRTMISVSASTEQSSGNISSVAQSTQEITSSVSEVARSAEQARQVTFSAVEALDCATRRVDDLGQAASEVGKVIEVIVEIAGQTKLLALNATIEAASAGDAGKGFAVVASEVKELAHQTNEATNEIRTRIESIQFSAANTVTEIAQIDGVIREANDLVAQIAVAVEQQASTMRGMAHNIQQAAVGIQQVSGHISEVAHASGDIATEIAVVDDISREVVGAIEHVYQQTAELSSMGAELKGMVGRYRLKEGNGVVSAAPKTEML